MALGANFIGPSRRESIQRQQDAATQAAQFSTQVSLQDRAQRVAQYEKSRDYLFQVAQDWGQNQEVPVPATVAMNDPNFQKYATSQLQQGDNWILRGFGLTPDRAAEVFNMGETYAGQTGELMKLQRMMVRGEEVPGATPAEGPGKLSGMDQAKQYAQPAPDPVQVETVQQTTPAPAPVAPVQGAQPVTPPADVRPIAAGGTNDSAGIYPKNRGLNEGAVLEKMSQLGFDPNTGVITTTPAQLTRLQEQARAGDPSAITALERYSALEANKGKTTEQLRALASEPGFADRTDSTAHGIYYALQNREEVERLRAGTASANRAAQVVPATGASLANMTPAQRAAAQATAAQASAQAAAAPAIAAANPQLVQQARRSGMDIATASRLWDAALAAGNVPGFSASQSAAAQGNSPEAQDRILAAAAFIAQRSPELAQSVLNQSSPGNLPAPASTQLAGNPPAPTASTQMASNLGIAPGSREEKSLRTLMETEDQPGAMLLSDVRVVRRAMDNAAARELPGVTRVMRDPQFRAGAAEDPRTVENARRFMEFTDPNNPILRDPRFENLSTNLIQLSIAGKKAEVNQLLASTDLTRAQTAGLRQALDAATLEAQASNFEQLSKVVGTSREFYDSRIAPYKAELDAGLEAAGNDAAKRQIAMTRFQTQLESDPVAQSFLEFASTTFGKAAGVSVTPMEYAIATTTPPQGIVNTVLGREGQGELETVAQLPNYFARPVEAQESVESLLAPYAPK